MTTIYMQTDHGAFPSELALALTAGSLIVYFAGALISKLILSPEGKTRRSFNLGLPPSRVPEQLFAISLVSAATTLSTVFVLFLTSARSLGFHLLICPLCFAAGIVLAFKTYRRMADYGYLDKTRGSGLLPRFAYSFTGSRTAAVVMTLASASSLFAVLGLEVRYGVLVFLYLLGHGNPSEGVTTIGSVATGGFLILLLGYVFVGGFKAVVTSDVWQYRTMQVGLGIVLLSLLYLAASSPLEWQFFRPRLQPIKLQLITFYVNVILIDIFGPVCLTFTWQRFYAFQACSINYEKAAYSAVRKMALLWGIIIAIAILCRTLSPSDSGLPTWQEFLRILTFFQSVPGNVGAWLAYLAFPLLIVAAFSGMYSSSDTCVSSLLYLTEACNKPNTSAHAESRPLGKRYYFAMAVIFSVCWTMYRELAPHVKDFRDIESLAMDVFGNAVLIAPTILLMSVCRPMASISRRRRRKIYVLSSICLGFFGFWTAHFYRSNTEHPLKEWDTLVGLAAAAIPAGILLFKEKREDTDARASDRSESNVVGEFTG